MAEVVSTRMVSPLHVSRDAKQVCKILETTITTTCLEFRFAYKFIY